MRYKAKVKFGDREELAIDLGSWDVYAEARQSCETHAVRVLEWDTLRCGLQLQVAGVFPARALCIWVPRRVAVLPAGHRTAKKIRRPRPQQPAGSCPAIAPSNHLREAALHPAATAQKSRG